MPTLEQEVVRKILGRDRASALDTDAYKMSMAQAGYPLRTESFYLAFRRPGQVGAWYNPLDLGEVVRMLRPELPTSKERGFLQAWGYGLTPAMEAALQGDLSVWSVPRGCWFGPNEPVLVVTGPSFLVSWLEPLVLMLHRPLQIATHAILNHSNAPLNGEGPFSMTYEYSVDEEPEEYQREVRDRARAISEALMGDTGRAFEVGMRSATSIPQHRLALLQCRQEGINRTSNLRLAYEMDMIPVGTTGHEHQQRYGDDLTAFRAIRDARPETPSYLFDTYDPFRLGIPAVREVVREDPAHRFSVRFDSGDQDAQFRILWDSLRKLTRHGNFIFEDGYTAAKTVKNERLLAGTEFPMERALYGYGGHLVVSNHERFTRDGVSAAYKLCESCGPRMKFSGTAGKSSYPGRLCTFASEDWETRLIGQQGEVPPPGFYPLEDRIVEAPPPKRVIPSPATAQIIEDIRIRTFGVGQE